MDKRVRALVLTGYGINCEQEMAHGYRLAGARVTVAHLSDVLEGEVNLDDFQILNFPGGFSFGDHLAAGRALADKLKSNRSFWTKLKRFIKDGKFIWGVCNGFQVMTKLGLLPLVEGKLGDPEISLMPNDSARFEDRWVRLVVNPDSPCVFTKGLSEITLACRHDEGKIVAREDVRDRFLNGGYVVMQYADDTGIPTEEYPYNPNGSEAGVAAICDDTGRIFGLMPHPESHLFFTNHPNWTHKKIELFRKGTRTLPVEGEGMQLFHNIVRVAAQEFDLSVPAEVAERALVTR
ncbi:MAG: phosphoribosylformylglycinamidine synthase subunit PurQ [Cyanobacteria bacterium REEB65]|nr:phosphoribosylformylglycinamidine synthase subunit PurQ [Cyanobacteria bacterium REEB65]